MASFLNRALVTTSTPPAGLVRKEESTARTVILYSIAVLTDIKEICDLFASEADNCLCSRLWEFDNLPSTLRLTLMKDEWFHILEVLERKNRLPIDVANLHRRSIMLNPRQTCHRDIIEGHWVDMPPSHRLCEKKWRDDGLLLPFGYKITHFDIPNPYVLLAALAQHLRRNYTLRTLFNGDSKEWMASFAPSTMPVQGSHLILDRVNKYGMPLNDFDGLQFFQRREMVEKFCRSFSSLKLRFVMYQLDATDVQDTVSGPRFIHKDGRFDRIDASNIADEDYLGTTMCEILINLATCFI